MTTKKITGSYYTPSHISDFIVNYIFKKHSGTNLNILEPSAGDGAFVRSIYSSDLLSENVNNVTAIELNSNECEKIKGINYGNKKRFYKDMCFRFRFNRC